MTEKIAAAVAIGIVTHWLVDPLLWRVKLLASILCRRIWHGLRFLQYTCYRAGLGLGRLLPKRRFQSVRIHQQFRQLGVEPTADDLA
ncbi:MAG: hypothetical protein M3Z29_05620 [Pseudomonadota bacterium]|nr:hypothetical protein [Pseudomonadota bacterium]